MEKKLIDYIPNFEELINQIYYFIEDKGGVIDLKDYPFVHALIFNILDDLEEVTINELFIKEGDIYFTVKEHTEVYCLTKLYGYKEQTILNILYNLEDCYELANK